MKNLSLRQVLLGIAIFGLTLLLCLPAPAGNKRRGTHRSTKAVAAERKKTIQTIEQQIRDARKVLADAESQATLSEQQLQGLRHAIEAARKAMEPAETDKDNPADVFEGIEAEILEAQGPKSEIGRAKAAFDAAREAVHREYRRVLSRPAEDDEDAPPQAATRMSKEEMEKLKQDDGYQSAIQKLKTAKQEYAILHKEVIEQCPQWTDAMEAARERQQDQSKAKQTTAAGTGQRLAAKRSLRTAKENAADARAVIAEGEARLREMGVQPPRDKANGGKPKK